MGRWGRRRRGGQSHEAKSGDSRGCSGRSGPWQAAGQSSALQMETGAHRGRRWRAGGCRKRVEVQSSPQRVLQPPHGASGIPHASARLSQALTGSSGGAAGGCGCHHGPHGRSGAFWGLREVQEVAMGTGSRWRAPRGMVE